MTDFPNGSGLFETVKTVGGKPQFLKEHLMRAFAGAEIIQIEIPDFSTLENSIIDFLESNPVQSESGRLRIEFRVDGDLRFSHVAYEPWNSPANLIVTGSRVNEKAPTTGIKALPYSDNMQLIQKARELGFDEVIRFNNRNQVCEGATSNLVLKISGEWVTPDLASGCLPGITRALCLEWFPIIERAVDRDELADVQSAFILSSLRGAQPASCIGPHALYVDEVMASEVQARLHAHSIE